MKLFDTHAHYEDHQFDADRYLRLDKLKNSNVKYIMNCCSDVKVFDVIDKISNDYAFAYCSFGIHPHWVEETPDNYLDLIKEKAQNPKCVAIGEMGLDYFFKEDKNLQKRIFLEQLELAKQLRKPVIIHDRDAHQDTMEILRKYKPQGILHRYGASSELMLEAVNWGMYVSVNNDCTHPNWANKHLEMLEKIPLDRLLVETDCPYGPIYNTNKRLTESSDVIYAIEQIARLKNETVEKMAEIVYQNSLRVYGIKE